MSNPEIDILEFERRARVAVENFFDLYKRKHFEDSVLYPATRRLVDWLDDFQAHMDIEEFHVPQVVPFELVNAAPEK